MIYNGEHTNKIANGVYGLSQYWGSGVPYPFTENQSSFSATAVNNQAKTLVYTEQVNFADFNTLTIETTNGTYDIDITSADDVGYLCISYGQSSGSNNLMYTLFTTLATPVLDNGHPFLNNYVQVGATINIVKIYLH
jgi:hypothetical protein